VSLAPIPSRTGRKQSSVAKAFNEFDAAGRMLPPPYCDRMVGVMEELVRFPLLTPDINDAPDERLF
jgi:hypothetical protein